VINLEVQINDRAAQALLQGLTPAAMLLAWRRTLRKVGRWLKGLAVRAVSRRVKLPMDILRRRLQYYERSADESKVWAGLNPIGAHEFGKPRKAGGGVIAGGMYFEGGWLMTKKRPNGPVFRRVGDDQKPFKVVEIDWAGAAAPAFKSILSKVEARLLDQLEKEIWAALPA
jgi:hypothetical protein